MYIQEPQALLFCFHSLKKMPSIFRLNPMRLPLEYCVVGRTQDTLSGYRGCNPRFQLKLLRGCPHLAHLAGSPLQMGHIPLIPAKG